MSKIFGPYPAIVRSVHDGDTVTLDIDLGFSIMTTQNCRIHGINAPELKTPEGIAARDFARTLLPIGAPVSIMSYGWDKYGGRFDGTISGVSCGNFAETMIAKGYAVKFPA